MRRVVIHSFENSLRLKNRLIGVGEHKEPFRHFGPGGVAEAEALCNDARRDLLTFVRPPEFAAAERMIVTPVGKGAVSAGRLDLRFDSPRASGIAANDRVVARLIPARQKRSDRKALVFHHALFQRYWG